MALDARSVRSLLKVAKEFATDFDELTVSDGDTTVSVKKSSQPRTVAAPDNARAKPAQVRRSALESLSEDPPAFRMG
jgi:hypothetical protein